MRRISMDQIIEILKGIRDDVDYETETSLVDGGIFDSFDIVGLVTELKEAYDIDITVEDLVPENFNSAEAIFNLVERILNED